MSTRADGACAVRTYCTRRMQSNLGERERVFSLKRINASAAGYALPPFVIFDWQSLNQNMTTGKVPCTLYGLSTKGWMNSEPWFLNQCAPQTRPLILLLDGHSSHYSPATIKLAAENQIVVFVFYT